MDWKKLMSAILGIEGNIVPIYIHNPKSQQLAAVVLATEAAIPDLVAALHPAPIAAAAAQPK